MMSSSIVSCCGDKYVISPADGATSPVDVSTMSSSLFEDIVRVGTQQESPSRSTISFLMTGSSDAPSSKAPFRESGAASGSRY